MVLRKAEKPVCHRLILERFLSGHRMCRYPLLYSPAVNADRFPIPCASHHSINGMLQPAQYSRIITELRKFPDRDAIIALREAKVSYILINRGLYAPDQFDRLKAAVEGSSRLWPVRSFGTGRDEVVVVQLNYEPE